MDAVEWFAAAAVLAAVVVLPACAVQVKLDSAYETFEAQPQLLQTDDIQSRPTSPNRFNRGFAGRYIRPLDECTCATEPVGSTGDASDEHSNSSFLLPDKAGLAPGD